jgi:quinol monooxygenase YgiN
MTAYNVVRFRVKPGHEQDFIEIEKQWEHPTKGFHKAAMIKTGDRTFCFIGEWDNMQAIANARASMIANLDKARHLLEDLGGGLGVTDPVSGEAVAEVP